MSELVEQLRSGGRDDEQWFELAEQAAVRIEALEARIEALEAARGIDLQQCAAQLDQTTATMEVAGARIETLEAALREMVCHDLKSLAAAAAVIAVLDKDP